MLPAEVVSGFTDQALGQSQSVAKYNSVEDLVKAHEHANTFIGNSIQLPTKDQDRAKWFGEQSPKLKDHGIGLSELGDLPPPTPEAYDFKVEGITPEDLKSDPIVSAWRKESHAKGLNNKQADAAVQFLHSVVLPAIKKEYEASRGEPINMIEDDAAIDAIYTERFKGESQSRQEAFKQGVAILSQTVPDLKDFMDGTAPNGKGWMPNGKHPALIHLISEIGRMTAQDFGGHVQGAPVVDGNAQQEIEKIMHDATHPKNALWKKGDKATREYVDELWKRTTGGK